MNEIATTISLNGREVTRRAPAHETLLRWLREVGALDARMGCGEGVCGACAVLVDGEAVSSCLVLAAQVDGGDVRTAFSLAGDDGTMSDLQRAFLDHGAVQCGFCTSGMLVGATELLEQDEVPDRDQIARHLEGNLCRCTGYANAIDAVREVAERRAGRSR